MTRLKVSFAILVNLLLILGAMPIRGEVGSALWRFSELSVEPTNPLAGDVVTVSCSVRNGFDQPVTGLQLRVRVVAPRAQYAEVPPQPIAWVMGGREIAPGRYVIAVPLNEAGRWWIDLTFSGEGREETTSVFVVVSPRLAAPSPSRAPLLLRGVSWVTLLRIEPSTGSLVRIIGDSAVRSSAGFFVVRRAVTPLGPVSRLYGGEWLLTLTLDDVTTGREILVELGPFRAALQPGSTSTPALTFAWTGIPLAGAVLLAVSSRLGEGWITRLYVVDGQSGERVSEQILPGALRGTQVLLAVGVAPNGQTVVVERALMLRTGGETRLSVLELPTLAVGRVHRWRFADGSLEESDCLANPIADVGVAGATGPRWVAWCRDATGPWLGVWDIETRQLLSRLATDPRETTVLSSPDGKFLYAVETKQQRVVRVELETGELATFPLAGEEPVSDAIDGQSIGSQEQGAVRSSLPFPQAALSPDGALLYVVFPLAGTSGAGVWVYETANFHFLEHLLANWMVEGVTVSSDGVVVAYNSDDLGEHLIILRDGEPQLVIIVPEKVTELLTG